MTKRDLTPEEIRHITATQEWKHVRARYEDNRASVDELEAADAKLRAARKAMLEAAVAAAVGA